MGHPPNWHKVGPYLPNLQTEVVNHILVVTSLDHGQIHTLSDHNIFERRQMETLAVRYCHGQAT